MALEFVQVASDREAGVAVHQSTESFAEIDPRAIAEALKTFSDATSVSASVGGPIVVRTQVKEEA
jgi:hypothetical protein